MNIYLKAGLLLVGALLAINHLIILPHFLFGLGLGLGIALELIGAYAARHDMENVKKFKKRLFHSIVR